MSDLRQTIIDTLSPDRTVRRNAENRLAQEQTRPGHCLELLRFIATADNSDLVVKQTASVIFKNIVKNGWDVNREDGTNGIEISQEDRSTIRSHLVQLMCTVPPQIQAQISEAISLIAAVDFPKNWTNLLPELVSQMQSSDLAVVNGVLKTANSIFKRFRFVERSDQLYEIILYSLNHIQQPLLVTFVEMSKSIEAFQNDAAQLKPRFEAMRSMCRIFYSLNYQDLPEFFEDNIGEWMREFAKYLQYRNPLLTDETEEVEPSPIDRLQAAIVANLALYADKDEEPFLPFLPEFTSLVWNNLIALTQYTKHDVLVTTSIKFLSSLVQKQMHRDIFKEQSTLSEIVTRIVIPNLMIREIDEERFEDDPMDFILTEVEGSDSESRRKCSQDLLRSMCRQFEEQTVSICSGHVASMLAEFAADNNNKWAAKDAAIHLMLGISIRRESNQGVSEVTEGVNVMEFFTSHILPELQDQNTTNRPMVKATALKFICTFRKQFTREQLVALMPFLIAYMGSPSIAVHTYAAYTIERILVTKETDATTATSYNKFRRTELKPFLETLFTSLFRIVDNTEWNENDYVMKCVMRSLATASEDVVPSTGIVLEKLTNALGRVCKNPRQPMFNHYLFESIAVLVKSVCADNPNSISQMEALLFPPFQTVLQMDIVEFSPYVFQVLAQLLEYRPVSLGLGESYTNLFQPLLTPSLWQRKGNVPALTRLMQAYIKKAPNDIVSGGHLMAVLGIFQQLVSSKATESSAFDLLSSIITYIPKETVAPNMGTIFQILFTKLQRSKTPRYTRLVTQFFALFVGKYGANAYFEGLNSIQASMSIMFLDQVWVRRLETDPPVRMEGKVQVVGLTKILCDSPVLLGDSNGKQLWARILGRVVDLITSPTWTSLNLDDEGDIEIGYDATYSVLTYARKQVEDPFPEIADPATTFSKGLQGLSSSQPGVLVPIIQQGLSSDPKLSTGLETVLQKAGVQLV